MAEPSVSVALPGNGAVSEEGLLLDHLRRMERTAMGCCAVHCHLSDLQTPYRKPHFIRIAARSFDSLINNFDATLYVLANSDMALICRNVRVEDIDTAIFKLRALFAEDPLTDEYPADGTDRFTTWYDLADSTDFAAFDELIGNLEANARQQQDGANGPGAGAQSKSTPLDSGVLMQLERRLQTLRLSETIRQQPAVDVRPGRGKRILFKEHYVAMSELKQRIAPDIDLFASPWLFHYMTDILDKRMLAVVGRMKLGGRTSAISLNLHVGTVMSPEFQVFNDQIGPHADKMVIEFQLVDVIADMGAFLYARKWLRDQAYRVLIDGLYPMALQFFDPGMLEPDFVKINWSPETKDDVRDLQVAELRDMIDYIGPDRMILARAESEEAIRWGLSLGVNHFQGFFVDKLVDRMAKKGLL